MTSVCPALIHAQRTRQAPTTRFPAFCPPHDWYVTSSGAGASLLWTLQVSTCFPQTASPCSRFSAADPRPERDAIANSRRDSARAGLNDSTTAIRSAERAASNSQHPTSTARLSPSLCSNSLRHVYTSQAKASPPRTTISMEPPDSSQLQAAVTHLALQVPTRVNSGRATSPTIT